jgi:hypothetical protein
MNEKTKTIIVSVAIIFSLIWGLGSLLYLATLSIFGLGVIFIFQHALNVDHSPKFQQYAMWISLAINGCTFLSMFLFPLGIFTQGVIHLATVATLLGLPMLMAVYGWRMALTTNKSMFLYGLIAFVVSGVITYLMMRAGNMWIPTFKVQQQLVFAFGAIAAGVSLFLIQLLFRAKTRHSKIIGLQQIILLIVALSVIHFKAYDNDTWGFRKQLPWSASDIHEWYWEEGFLPDYSYCLKAKMSEEAFLDYVQEFGLKKKEMPLENEYVRWSGPRTEESWWDVSTNLDDTYMFIDAQGDSWTLAKYENGYLYLHSSEF